LTTTLLHWTININQISQQAKHEKKQQISQNLYNLIKGKNPYNGSHTFSDGVSLVGPVLPSL